MWKKPWSQQHRPEEEKKRTNPLGWGQENQTGNIELGSDQEDDASYECSHPKDEQQSDSTENVIRF